MNPKLESLFNLMEADRQKLVGRLSKLSTEQLNHSKSGKWSINQIMAHLMTAEKLSLQYMTKKIQGIHETENTGVVEELKMIALKISQRLPFKFKAPKAVVEFTPANTDSHKLNADWNSIRKELKDFLEKFPNDQVDKKVYRHVVAGRLNIKHALIFFREHYIHHLPQINKLIRP